MIAYTSDFYYAYALPLLFCHHGARLTMQMICVVLISVRFAYMCSMV